MDKNETREKTFELVFGIIAILAAIGEALANGFDIASVMGAVKDVSGTLIIVVLFIMFVKQIPRKPKNLVDILKYEVENWGMNNAPLIFKAEGYVSAKDSPYTQGFLLLQNPKRFASLIDLNPESLEWIDYAKYGSGKKLTGKFIDLVDYKKMTEESPRIRFIMEQSHFSKMEKIDDIIEDIIRAINIKYKDIVSAKREGNSYKFVLTFKKKIETVSEVERLVNVLDYVLSLVKVVS